MFRRARVRLTLLYIGLFALVLGIFSGVFYIWFATVLAPTFDLAERHLLPHRATSLGPDNPAIMAGTPYICRYAFSFANVPTATFSG
jgi:hypothetical protein